jgi:hypothetical protein
MRQSAANALVCPLEEANIMQEVTRYLSAAVYRDKSFRNTVICSILENRHRAIAPCAGLDLATVVRHCLRARRRDLFRDIALTAAFAVPLLAGGITFYDDVLFVLSSPHLLGSFFDYYGGAILLTVFVAFLIVFVVRFATEHRLIARTFDRSAFATIGNGGSNPTGGDRLARTVAVADNVIVYGGFSPFVGAGFDHGGWSFAVNIRKPSEEWERPKSPKAFRLPELYECVEHNLHDLNLRNLVIEDKLFVNGEEVRDVDGLLPDRFGPPVGHLEQDAVARYIQQSDSPVRHYKCIQRVDWGGELVISVFLRFRKSKEYLYSEASYFLMPPLKREYYAIDQFPRTLTLRRFSQIFWSSLLATPILWIAAPFRLAFALYAPIVRWQQGRAERNEIRNNRRFNYGATSSIRELAGSTQYRDFFQRLDKDMTLKLVEKELLDAIIDFLDAHDIDTSELRERRSMILNNGVIMSGGTVQAETVAMGGRARAASFLRRGDGQATRPLKVAG